MNTPTTVEELRALLDTHDIPTELWGTDSAKTFQHLLDEVREGESTLTDEDGTLIREVALVAIKVRYANLTLKEDRQVFRDGRTRRRDIAGIGEKLKPGEKTTHAMNRAMLEELGISSKHFRRVGGFVRTSRREESRSYPGLLCVYTTYTVTVEIDSTVFREDGYTEKQTDKVTYFKWVRT